MRAALLTLLAAASWVGRLSASTQPVWLLPEIRSITLGIQQRRRCENNNDYRYASFAIFADGPAEWRRVDQHRPQPRCSQGYRCGPAWFWNDFHGHDCRWRSKID